MSKFILEFDDENDAVKFANHFVEWAQENLPGVYLKSFVPDGAIPGDHPESIITITPDFMRDLDLAR